MREGPVAVLGLGLIGGSIGGALRGRGLETRGFDSSPEARSAALDRGLIDVAHDDLWETVREASAVIMALPISATLSLIEEIDAASAPKTFLLDTGSVKRPVVAAMRTLPGAARAIGGHPLAGKEQSGPEYADSSLFRDRPFVLTPSDLTDAATVERAEDLVRLLGGQPLVASAEEHDRILARTSHLPQILSSALALCVGPEDWTMSGPALADMTRLASSDPALWRDILLANADNLGETLTGYIAELSEITRALQARDAGGVERIMARGRTSSRAGRSGTPV